MSSVLELESTPEIQDLRKKVGDFLTEFIYPNEKILDRYDDSSRKTMKSIQNEAKKRGRQEKRIEAGCPAGCAARAHHHREQHRVEHDAGAEADEIEEFAHYRSLTPLTLPFLPSGRNKNSLNGLLSAVDG